MLAAVKAPAQPAATRDNGGMRRKLGFLLAVALPLLACAPARTDDAPPGPDPAVEPIVDYVDQAVATERFRGAVEVRSGDKVLLRRGFGYADPAAGAPNGPNIRFPIASVTTQFTALAVLVLQEQGKLDVADAVCAYLPNCPPEWAPITIDELLTHTSGLHTDDVTDLDQFYANVGSRRPTPDQLVQLIATRPLDFPPGTAWAYSNAGYVVLGKLVEQVSGQSYGDFLREGILDPLGMSDTGYQPDHPPGKEYAVGYQDWANPSPAIDDSVLYAAGGMYSTVTDLGRWQRFLLTDDPPVVRADTLADLLKPRVAESPVPGRWYGYGVESRGATMTAIDSYGHSGRTAGFNSYVETRPAIGVTVTVLANITIDAEDFGHTLAELVPKPQ